MTESLALLSALCFGLTHFVSGVVSRTWNGVTVAAAAQVGGTVLSLVLVAALPAGHPTAVTLLWGVASGIGTGVGVGFLYRAMSRGPMSVVAPVSDVAGVALPVVVGVLLLRERPSPWAYAGIVVALLAIWLVSRGRADGGDVRDRRDSGDHPRRTIAGVPDALIAGVGLATHFVAIERIPAGAGLWPVAVSRVVSIVVLVVLVVGLGAPRGLPWRPASAAFVAGAVGTVATILYWTAVDGGLMTTTVVLASLYPAIPVVLAIVFLRERLAPGQVLGLLGAAVAIPLISA
ncbi:DMT family transporter [Promicromonospora panici]|uniref:DMT family transporter n=1 Tax=Promicromonospora panici TaxID=2219658 RepID=UPI00101D6C9D|nr:DMT family transporter [Promicromonospora panici]